MTPDDRYRRYLDLQEYVGWTDADAAAVRSAAALLDPHLGPLIDDFYAEVDRHPEARKVVTGGPGQVARLKGTLLAWLRELLAGPFDRDYVDRRWRVGWRHVEIGLDQVYTNAALARVRRGLLDALDGVERRHVAEVLRLEGGNKVRAARALGVSRRTLYRLIDKYGLAGPSPG